MRKIISKMYEIMARVEHRPNVVTTLGQIIFDSFKNAI